MYKNVVTYNKSDFARLAGQPDGEDVFIALIGFEVPSFVDPRYDLVKPGRVGKKKKLEYHVPIKLRGPYRVSNLPDDYTWTGEVDDDDYCLCTEKTKEGFPCRSRALNRSYYCIHHGGGLHPADVEIDRLPDGVTVGPDRLPILTRVQKFQQEILKVDDLSDEEIQGQYIWDSNGKKVSSRRISDKLHKLMIREMMNRSSDKLAAKLPNMLDTIFSIAEDTCNEPADRLKAAIWASERIIGKTPEVIVHGTTDSPFEQVFTQLETTTREKFRSREIDSGFIEAEVVEISDSGQVSGNSTTDGSTEDLSHRRRHSTFNEKQSDGSPTIRQQHDDLHDSNSGTTEASKELPGERAKRIAERRKAIKDAKNKRFVARLNGGSVDNLPFWVNFKPVGKSGHYDAKIIPPAAQTPELAELLSTADVLDSQPYAQP